MGDQPSKIDFERVKRDNQKHIDEIETLKKNNKDLTEIIKNTPKAPTGADFAVLQRRLEIMEKNQKMKAMEMTEGLKQMGFVNSNMNNTLAWEKEKQQYMDVIRKKNRDIAVFRQELDGLL